MIYQETLDYLFSRLPMYQRVGKSAYKKDLTNTLALMEELANPHQKFKSIHIAGTNGKGTCAHGIAAILQKAGYKVGLYTSPHLKNFTERIKINGEEIKEEAVTQFVNKIQSTIDEVEPSFFEITVAMAFNYFSEEQVDIAVIETGLGGRLDSTNVITPEVCLITNIGYDHMDMLGNTLAQIAAEKAGIIKPGIPVVIGQHHEETYPVFIEKIKENNAKLYMDQKFSDEVRSSLYPYHKSLNRDSIRMVIEVLKELGWSIEDKAIFEGFEDMEVLTGLKGRCQTLSQNPLTIADVSHNVEGLMMLFDYVESIRVNAKGKIHLVFGTVKDKDLKPIFDLFPSDVNLYWTQSTVPRSLPMEELAIQGVMSGLTGECFKNVNEAIIQAKGKALPEDIVLITGSTFVVAEVNQL